MRILHVIHSTSGGGAERQLLLLNRELVSLGVQSSIWCVRDNANAAGSEDQEILISSSNHRQPLKLFKELGETICTVSPDIVHVWLPPAITIPGMLAAAVNRKIIVLSYRNRMWFNDLGAIIEYGCGLALARGCISNNPVAQSTRPYQFLYGLKRGITIANSSGLSPRMRGSHAGSGTSCIRILAAGRLTHQKNFDTLLRALEGLPPKPAWTCSIFGDGDWHPELSKMTLSHPYADRINLHTFTKDLQQEMRTSDLLVAPSRYEGSPNVLMEAIEIGLPAITSKIPAHQALLGKTYCADASFPPEDPLEMARVLTRAINDGGFRESLKARQSRLDFLTPTESAEKYIRYYMSLFN
jgi:glycosyltransferase involved in cell wall biosynthesis